MRNPIPPGLKKPKPPAAPPMTAKQKEHDLRCKLLAASTGMLEDTVFKRIFDSVSEQDDASIEKQVADSLSNAIDQSAPKPCVGMGMWCIGGGMAASVVVSD